MATLTPTDTPRASADPDTLTVIVARYPAALQILHTFGLDTCHGSSLALRTALEPHGLDPEQVRVALDAAIQQQPR